MSFRRRLALSCAAAVAVAVVLGSVLAYLVVRDTLRSQIDSALNMQVENVSVSAGPPTGLPLRRSSARRRAPSSSSANGLTR